MKFNKLSREIKLKLKEIIYRAKLAHHQRTMATLSTGPDVLITLNEAGIGNLVWATPFIQAIRMIWPKSEITLLTSHGDLFDGWAIVDHIITSIDQLKDTSFDHTFFPYWVNETLPDWIVGCDLGQIHSTKIALGKLLLKPEIECSMDLARKLGYKGLTPPLYVSLKKPQLDISPASLRICIVPCANNQHRWRHKRWPYYDKLIQLLLTQYPQAQICIIGTKDDHLPELPPDDRIVDLRGSLTLRETAWLLKTADLAIGNDCGPIRIADAVQTWAIVIYGPTCEMKNSQKHKFISISASLPCRPCQYTSRIKTCQNPQCINGITPEMVIQKAKSLLNT